MASADRKRVADEFGDRGKRVDDVTARFIHDREAQLQAEIENMKREYEKAAAKAEAEFKIQLADAQSVMDDRVIKLRNDHSRLEAERNDLIAKLEDPKVIVDSKVYKDLQAIEEESTQKLRDVQNELSLLMDQLRDPKTAVSSEPYRQLQDIEERARIELRNAQKQLADRVSQQDTASELMKSVLEARAEIVDKLSDPDAFWNKNAMEESIEKLENLINTYDGEAFRALGITSFISNARRDLDVLRRQLYLTRDNASMISQQAQKIEEQRRATEKMESEKEILGGLIEETVKAHAAQLAAEKASRLDTERKLQSELRKTEELKAASTAKLEEAKKKSDSRLAEVKALSEAKRVEFEKEINELRIKLLNEDATNSDLSKIRADLIEYVTRIERATRAVDAIVEEFLHSRPRDLPTSPEDVNDLQEKASDAEKAIRDIKREYGVDDSTKYPVGNAYLDGQLRVLEEYNKEAARKEQQLSSLLREYQEKNERAEEELATLRANYDTSDKGNFELRERIESLQQEIEARNKAAGALDARILTERGLHEDALASLRNELALERKSREANQSDALSLKESLESTVREYKDTSEKLRNAEELASQLPGLQEELKSKTARVDELMRKLAEAEARHESAVKSLASSRELSEQERTTREKAAETEAKMFDF
eukprot:jgi/Mesvir1/10063/Mv05544-RA.1